MLKTMKFQACWLLKKPLGLSPGKMIIVFMLNVPEHEILIFINCKMQTNEAFFMLITADYVICPDHKFVGILTLVISTDSMLF